MTLPEIGPRPTPEECENEDYLDSLYTVFLSDLVHGSISNELAIRLLNELLFRISSVTGSKCRWIPPA